MKICSLLAGLFLVGTTTVPALAQSFPSKSITIVVPSTPGGVTDSLGRMLAKWFSATWNRPAVVENKAGANNQIGAEYVARSPADGYTLLVAPEVTFSVNPHLYSKLAYDPVKDFAPISGLIALNASLVTHPNLPVQSVSELIALAKQKPGELNYATVGPGSVAHLHMEMLQMQTGMRMQAVHYRGATPAFSDVIAGHVKSMMLSVGTVVPQWKAGHVKLLALGSRERMALLPDVPTIAESGVPRFEARSWFGLFAPAGTPLDVIMKINAEVQTFLIDPQVRKGYLEPQFFTPIGGTPEQLAEYLRADTALWAKVTKEANVKVD